MPSQSLGALENPNSFPVTVLKIIFKTALLTVLGIHKSKEMFLR